jgi:hypothetical protein
MHVALMRERLGTFPKSDPADAPALDAPVRLDRAPFADRLRPAGEDTEGPCGPDGGGWLRAPSHAGRGQGYQKALDDRDDGCPMQSGVR